MTTSDPSKASTSDDSDKASPLAAYPDHNRSRSFFAQQLLLVAGALFALFASAMLNPLIPPAILNPAWQIRLVASLVSNGFLPLLGLALVQLSYLQEPLLKVKEMRVKLARIALLASLGFVLLVPLQSWATWRLIRENFQSLDSGRPPVDLPLRQMEEAIKQAPDAQTLQASLTILRGPAIAPQDMAKPLPELKQMLLGALQEARQKLLKDAGRVGTDPRVWTLVQDTIRLSLTSIVIAIAYSGFGQRKGVPMTLFEEVNQRWQRRSRIVESARKRKIHARRQGARTPR